MPLTALLLAGAVGEGVLWVGAFDGTSRIVFGSVALGALLAALITEPRRAAGLLRTPAVLVLAAIAILGALSATWTLGLVGDALGSSLAIGGYGAIAVAAGVICVRRWGVVAVAALICVLAVGSAAVGLLGATVIGEPIADRIGGAWRPGGTVEYSAALALLQVSALPALLRAMCARRRLLAGAAGFAAAVAATDLALAESRAEFALAAIVCLLAVAWPKLAVRGDRGIALGAVGLLAVVGALAHVIAGGYSPPDTLPGVDPLLGLAAVCLAAIPVWLVSRGWLESARGSPAWRPRVAVAVVLAVALAGGIAGLESAVATGKRSHRARLGLEPSGGILHGRGQLWHAAIETFADYPLKGAGAYAFAIGSARYQKGGPILFAHDLALELAAELGVGGLLLSLALYAFTARLVWRTRGSPDAWLVSSAVWAFMAANLVDWPWDVPGAGGVFAVGLGALLAIATGARQADAIETGARRPD